jgi:hypothetical protein
MILEAVQLQAMHFIPDGTAQPKLALALDSRMIPMARNAPPRGDATAAVAAYFAAEGRLHPNPAPVFRAPPRRPQQSRSRSEAFMSMAGSVNSQDSYHPPSLDYTSHVDRPRLPFQDNLSYEPAFSVRPQREVVDEPSLNNMEPPSTDAHSETPYTGPTPMDASKALRSDPSYQSVTAAFNYLSTDTNSRAHQDLPQGYMSGTPTNTASLSWGYPHLMHHEYSPSAYPPEMPAYHAPSYQHPPPTRDSNYAPFSSMPASAWAMPELS